MKRVLIQFIRTFLSKRVNWLNAGFLVILVILHYLSISWMAQSRSIEMIMACGSPPGISTVGAILGFILLRTTIIFLLPGFILSYICLELFDFFCSN